MDIRKRIGAPDPKAEGRAGEEDQRVEGERGPGAFASPALRLPACFPASATALIEGGRRSAPLVFSVASDCADCADTHPTIAPCDAAPSVEGERCPVSRSENLPCWRSKSSNEGLRCLTSCESNSPHFASAPLIDNAPRSSRCAEEFPRRISITPAGTGIASTALCSPDEAKAPPRPLVSGGRETLTDSTALSMGSPCGVVEENPGVRSTGETMPEGIRGETFTHISVLLEPIRAQLEKRGQTFTDGSVSLRNMMDALMGRE